MFEVKETTPNGEQQIEKTPESLVLDTNARGVENGLTDVKETTARVPHEVKSWMEKIEEDPVQARIVNDDTGQPVMVPSPNQNPKIVLPISRQRFVEGFKKSVGQASRWLSGFFLKMIKKNKGNVKFKLE